MVDNTTVEAVFYGTGTLCISTQAGCHIGCPFCLSGTRGLFRNLTCDEMILQLAAAKGKGFDIKRVTLSGIGEPLYNLENVLPFIEHCQKHNFPASLTTTGGPLKNFEKILQFPHNGLMISLHAGTAATHRKLIPGGPSFEELWQILTKALKNISRRKRRKIGINYLLLEGINDSTVELDKLSALLQPFSDLTLHLLCCNTAPTHFFRSPSPSRFEAVYHYLRTMLPNVRRSNRWRQQEYGGCGTLLVYPD